jgi:hypothetical protein
MSVNPRFLFITVRDSQKPDQPAADGLLNFIGVLRRIRFAVGNEATQDQGHSLASWSQIKFLNESNGQEDDGRGRKLEIMDGVFGQVRQICFVPER